MRWEWLPKGKCYGAAQSYAKARTVGLLLNEKNRSVQELVQRLLEDGKDVHTLYYVSAADKQTLGRSTALEQRRSFSEKALSSCGLLRGAAIQRFLNQEYDLLINTSLSPCPYLEQIRSRSNACLKVGLCSIKAEKTGYQLLIRSDQQAAGLACVYSYLQRL